MSIRSVWTLIAREGDEAPRMPDWRGLRDAPLGPGSRWVWLLWLGLLAGGIAMAAWASVDDHFPADVAVGRWIQANDAGGQGLVDFIRGVGSSVAALATFLIVAGALAARGRPRMAALAAALVLGLVLQVALKEIVDRPRTSVDFLEQRAGFDSASFPSGHVMSSLLAGGLVMYLSLRIAGPVWLRAAVLLRAAVGLWGVGMLVLNPWVSISSGVHWPSDVLGGLVWGLVVMIPALVLLERARALDGDPDARRGGTASGED